MFSGELLENGSPLEEIPKNNVMIPGAFAAPGNFAYNNECNKGCCMPIVVILAPMFSPGNGEEYCGLKTTVQEHNYSGFKELALNDLGASTEELGHKDLGSSAEEETLGAVVDGEETLGAVVDGEETLGAYVDGEETLGAYVDGEETLGAYVDGEEIPKWVEEMAEEHVYNELNDPNSEQSKAYACFISEQSQVSESLKCPMGCGSLKEKPHFSVCKGCHLIIGYQKNVYGLSSGQAQIKLKEWNSQMSDTPEELRAGFTPCSYGNSCHYWDQNACASIDPVTGETKHWGQPIKGGCGRGHWVGLTRINYNTGKRGFARVEPGRGQVWVNKFGWELIPGAELVRWKATPPSKSSD